MPRSELVMSKIITKMKASVEALKFAHKAHRFSKVILYFNCVGETTESE